MNSFGARALMQGDVPVMRARASGVIVDVDSLAGRCGDPPLGGHAAK